MSKKSKILSDLNLSNIEVRVIASIQSSELGEDIHTKTACLMFNVEPCDVTSDMRKAAKDANYFITYGLRR